jgi:hypothetical protein
MVIWAETNTIEQTAIPVEGNNFLTCSNIPEFDATVNPSSSSTPTFCAGHTIA